MTTNDATHRTPETEKPKRTRNKATVNFTIDPELKEWADSRAAQAEGGPRSKSWYYSSLVEADRQRVLASRQQGESAQP